MPSITVDGLAGLCEALRQFNFLVSDDDINRSPSNPGQESETSSDSDATDSEGSSYVSDTDEEAADKTHYIWSFSIRGVYQATQFLGEGANAYVFRVFHTLTGSEAAAKIEAFPIDKDQRPFLEHEIAVYKMLGGAPPGIPRILWSGRDENHAVLIMDRFGPNLGHIRRFCRGIFTLRTICMLAEQMLTRLEFVHSRGIAMCDVKPQNFAMGVGRAANIVHLLDFGHLALYIDPNTNSQVPPDRPRHALGTARYASVAAHTRQAVSPRDDVESLLYVLLDLLVGDLPWPEPYNPGPKGDDLETQERHIRECKAGSAVFTKFLAGLPAEFSAYHAHCTGLNFGEQPDYEFLRELFRGRMDVEGWDLDSDFDWVTGGTRERGTLIPEEYVLDLKLVCADVDMEP
ncbi:kinase-like protein [Trametes versicolor FP-101664 SS1]|uniref:kinase-like protein n=1 Tax=Trametes versicolor (strain FP-101664) TaxID=717944 RepID=UPI0004622B4A|nr:kinase-like protein [Trametes versicolor FP-101664 SS1]EIW54980.1 kinase-like protein [Trametes versicolor FP-101664 SS1]